MKVLCKRATKQIVKGVIYDVLFLQNQNPGGNNFFHPNIIIKINDEVNSSFSVNNFTQTDGTPLPEINWQVAGFTRPNWREGWIDENNLPKAGDYVVYKFKSSKTLVQDKTYKITDVNVIKKGGVSYAWYDIFLKIEGSNRWLSSRTFRKLSTQEARDLHLKEVFDEATGVEKVDKTKRKIDHFEGFERDKILITCLLQAMLDKSRNNMTVVEWAANKTGSLYSLTVEDFAPILEKNLTSILETWV
jgi:hypothetical protein